jgi:hypothetical protein
VSYYLGPSRDRWTPSSWRDVVDAAANGLLDETQWVELKEMIRTGKDANLELARDLAAMAVDGGLLVVGIRDQNGKAGEVVGTSLAGLADRGDQVSRDRVHPPLIVRPVEVPDPSRQGHGCLIVVVDASTEAPHMADDRYWGRGPTGKRNLGDSDVRRLLDLNSRRRDDFARTFREQVEAGPLSGRGCLHVRLSPRAGRSGALTQLVDTPHELMNLVANAARPDPRGWRIDSLLQSRKRVGGIDLSNVDLNGPQSAIGSQFGYAFTVLSVRDDGQVGLTVAGIVGDLEVNGQNGRWVSTDGIVSCTRQLLAVVARLADLAGYGGSWDVGMAVTDLSDAKPYREDGLRTRMFWSAYPDAEYVGLTGTTTTELVEQPNEVLVRLSRPLLRVLGDEGTLEQATG